MDERQKRIFSIVGGAVLILLATALTIYKHVTTTEMFDKLPPESRPMRSVNMMWMWVFLGVAILSYFVDILIMDKKLKRLLRAIVVVTAIIACVLIFLNSSTL